jgi:SAM-dependent methyltransferase
VTARAVEAWTARTVAWYARANARSDYAERVLAAAAPWLAGCASALDVGAGFGALALPLARRLPSVTALEPSPPMAAALRAGAAAAGLANVTLVEAAWGERPVAPHDLVLCAHVGPLLRAGSPFLAQVRRVARRAVVLVRDAPGGDDKFFFPELYPRLLGRPYERSCGDAETVAAVTALGIRPTVTPIEYRSDQPFDSLDEACDFWMTYMRLEGEAPRAFLGDFLAARLERDGAGWRAPFRKRALVLSWRVKGPT